MPGGVGRTRSRERVSTLKGKNLVEYNGSIISQTTPTINLWEFGFIEDENHDMALMSIPGHRLNVGGPLRSFQTHVNIPIASQHVGSGAPWRGQSYNYAGPVIAWPEKVPTAWVAQSSWNEMSAGIDSNLTRIGLGATAISRCKPASPSASFAVFLAELIRDGVPSLLSRFMVEKEANFFRNLSGDYLNVEFGWKPFVSDLRATAKSLAQQADILDDLRRNSGKAMRREYEFPSEMSSSTIISDNHYPWPTLTLNHLRQAGRTVRQFDTKKTWFAGEFRYYYPPVTASVIARMRGWARQILGVDLTPATLWGMTPWTWLADWVANIGDVLANISAISDDNLTMRYGYLMQEATREYRYTHFGLTTNYGFIPPTITGSYRITAKTRIGASPYGFGLDWDTLSPRQLAILAAIGITQGSVRVSR